MMKLLVKELNGSLHAIEADPLMRFDRFRELVHKAVPGVPIESQKLIFGNRLLEAETLKAACLKDGGNLPLRPKLK